MMITIGNNNNKLLTNSLHESSIEKKVQLLFETTQKKIIKRHNIADFILFRTQVISFCTVTCVALFFTLYMHK